MNAKLLFPTDFSTLGQTALEMATDLARQRNAKLLIVHVEEPPVAYGGGELYYGIEAPDRAGCKRALAAVPPTSRSAGPAVGSVIGNPATAIVQLAETEGVDMIVMPTHGRTGLMRLLMGSVAEEVVRKAGCPVLTIKAAVPVTTKQPAPVTTAPQRTAQGAV